MRAIYTILLTMMLTFNLSSCDADIPVKPVAEGVLEVHYIDVGQADAALVLCGGESMLIDGGNVADSSLIVSYLAEHGVEHLDYVVDTHAHEDHVGGLSGALAKYGADRVYAPVTEYDSKAFRDFVKYAGDLAIPSPGEAWTVGTAAVTVLGPVQEYDDTNDTSIVLRVDFGENSFLFTGDMERGAEADLLESGADVKADVLKVGHHGSSTSTSYPFLREVMPEYAVISCETGNSYGHPHEETLSRLRDADVTLYRTDMQGTVVAASDGKEISFAVEKNPDAVTNPTDGSAEDYYIGNLNSQVFHRPTCSGLPAEQNQTKFDTREDALDAGYTPCGRCKP